MMNWGSLTGMASNWTPEMMGPYVGLMVLGIVIFVIVCLAIYIYSAFAWMAIGNKLKYKNSWLAWIPIANFAMILQLGDFPWGLIFLVLIPILGWIALAVLGIIATWRIFEKRKYPGALSLISLAAAIPWVGFIAGIASLIVLGFVAWTDKK